jgi:hypothetical protein
MRVLSVVIVLYLVLDHLRHVLQYLLLKKPWIDDDEFLLLLLLEEKSNLSASQMQAVSSFRRSFINSMTLTLTLTFSPSGGKSSSDDCLLLSPRCRLKQVF